MIEWDYIVVALCFLLLFFLVWKEIKRKNKSRLLMRLLSTTLAVASLACFAFPLYYGTKQNAAASNEAIIVTEGFNADSVTKFLSANGNAMPVISFNRSIKIKDKYNAHYVADIRLLSREFANINTFHVFGFGFDDNDLNALPKRSMVFHQSHLSSGITSINWQQKIKEGERLMVQGTYNNSTSSNTKIVISHFTTTLDSVLLSANKNQAFTLSTIPKAEGRTTFSMAVINNNDTIEKETLPVQAERGARLKILMLASSPDFDNKFLQNHLSKEGFEVAARTTISKNKYAYDYLNTPAVSLSNITSSLLDKFDVLIADAAELSVISPSQLSLIQSQVAQKSMGLVIKADSIGKSSFYSTHFPVNAVAGDTQQQLKIFLFDTSGKLPVLTADYPLSIKNEPSTQPLVLDKQNKVYVSSTLYGSGKIIFTTLSNTYTWALSGNEEDYNRFWSTLLNKAAAQPSSTEAWSVSPLLPVINTPVQLQLQTKCYRHTKRVDERNAGLSQKQCRFALRMERRLLSGKSRLANGHRAEWQTFLLVCVSSN